jgi:hypothetical protein
MKKIISILIIIAFFSLSISAQKVSIGMKTGTLYSKVNFDWSHDIINKNRPKIRQTYTLFAEGQLYDFIYLGAEIGTCSYNVFMNFKYDDNGGVNGNPTYKSHVTYFGWYQQEQFYFAISPQFKFGKTKWLSIGSGFGLYNNYINRFHNGTRTSQFEGNPKTEVLYLDGYDMYLPNSVKGGFLNITLNPKLNKHLGLLIDCRYIFNNPSNGQITKVKPDISFNSFAATAGLSFHF